MNIFSRLGEALDDGVVWRDLLSADVAGCGLVPWCSGEHEELEGTVHVRRVATAVRPDGTTLLVIVVRQRFGADGYNWRPVIHIEREHQGDDEFGLSLGAQEMEVLAQVIRFGGPQGEDVADLLLTVAELISTVTPAPRRVLTREGLDELFLARC